MDSIPAVVVGGIIMNITSVVGVVIMNKVCLPHLCLQMELFLAKLKKEKAFMLAF